MKACSFLQRERQRCWGQAVSLGSIRGMAVRSGHLAGWFGAPPSPGCPLGPQGPARTWALPVGPCPPLTCSLYSLRLRMTAVICWSMKMRMVTRMAGTTDTRQTHHGLAPKGKTIQPRAGFVGCGKQKGHGSRHPPVGSAVQLGDGTSPGHPGWSPVGTQGCSTWGEEEHPLSSWGCSWAT